MIVEGIKKYFKECPLLKGGKINVDYLEEDAARYSIEPAACNSLLRRYIDGSSQKQFMFYFASREFLDPQDLTNLENNAFYEKLEEWIESRNAAGVYPDFGDKKKAQRVEAITHGYNYSQNGKTARYQMQCRVIYLDKGGF